jgi:hypothetical protein
MVNRIYHQGNLMQFLKISKTIYSFATNLNLERVSFDRYARSPESKRIPLAL